QRVGAVRDEPPRGVPDERHAVASGREPGGVVAVAADRLAGPRDAEQPVSLDVVVEARVAHRNQVAPRIEGVCLAGRAVAPARDTRARAGSLRAERGGAEVVLLGRGHLEAAVRRGDRTVARECEPLRVELERRLERALLDGTPSGIDAGGASEDAVG